MNELTDLLDDVPPVGTSRHDRWFGHVRQSLRTDPRAWLDLAGAEDALSVERSWVLLSWVEGEASVIARKTTSEPLEVAAFAMSLLEHGPLDLRDRQLVGALLHRAAVVAGIDYGSAVRAGCERAGELGRECVEWLVRCPSSTPATHAELGAGDTFEFRRVPLDFDVEALERWLRE